MDFGNNAPNVYIVVQTDPKSLFVDAACHRKRIRDRKVLHKYRKRRQQLMFLCKKGFLIYDILPWWIYLKQKSRYFFEENNCSQTKKNKVP